MARKLWFGVALFSALASVYAGLFEWQWLQYALLPVAVIAVLAALVSTERP